MNLFNDHNTKLLTCILFLVEDMSICFILTMYIYKFKTGQVVKDLDYASEDLGLNPSWHKFLALRQKPSFE